MTFSGSHGYPARWQFLRDNRVDHREAAPRLRRDSSTGERAVPVHRCRFADLRPRLATFITPRRVVVSARGRTSGASEARRFSMASALAPPRSVA